jgi:integrase
MSRFNLYKRQNGVFYAEIYHGGEIVYRSTRVRNRNQAAMIAAKWIAEGIPDAQGKEKQLSAITDYKAALRFMQTGDVSQAQALELVRALQRRGLVRVGISQAEQGGKSLIEFLLEYWDYDNSKALKTKRAHGKQVLKDTCYNARNVILNKWKPYFGDVKLGDVTRNDLENFGLHLKDRGLAGKTINCALFYGKIAIKWAFDEKLISENITAGIMGFKGGEVKRSIPTDQEMALLADYRYWRSRRGYAAFMLASTSALRNSEIRALRREDLAENILHIKHGHNNRDGLKTTKNGEKRIVYILPEIRNMLLELLADNPYKDADKPFIFYNDLHPEKPCGIRLFPDSLKTAMKNASIALAGRKIDFHSLRHYSVKKTADAKDLRAAAKVAGHKTLAVTGRYADHIDENEMLEMGREAEDIFKFRKMA